MVQTLFVFMKCLWDHLGNPSLYGNFFVPKIGWYSPFTWIRDSKPWSSTGIDGVYRFLGRTWRLIVGPPLPDGSYKDGTIVVDDKPTMEQLRMLHKCISKVTICILSLIVLMPNTFLWIVLCIFYYGRNWLISCSNSICLWIFTRMNDDLFVMPIDPNETQTQMCVL